MRGFSSAKTVTPARIREFVAKERLYSMMYTLASRQMPPKPDIKQQDNAAGRVGDAYARLRNDILSGRMPPGEIQTETEIGARLGMSRTPVREALIRLSAEGLAVVAPRKGACAAALDLKKIADIYDLLISMEPDAASALAQRRPTVDALAPLYTAQDILTRALRDDDPQTWLKADDTWHRALWQATQNSMLPSAAGPLLDQLHRARMLVLRLDPEPQRGTDEHLEIMTHLEQGDVSRTRRTCRRHRRREYAELADALERLDLTRI